MRTVRDLLQEADPLRHEPDLPHTEWKRLRASMLDVASRSDADSLAWRWRPRALVAAALVCAIALAALAYQMLPPGSTTLQAAVRFELRLAETDPAPGLREVRIAGSDRVVYLHRDAIVTNADIAGAAAVASADSDYYRIQVHLSADAGERMRRATAGHIGRPMAMLIDGSVVAAPVVRSEIGASAVLTGDYTEAEAQRIARGIVPRP